jgi:hypothetical protein
MSYVQHPVLRVDPNTLSLSQRRTLLRQAKNAHALGEISYGEYEGLFKKIKSVVKKIAAPVTKVVQKVTSKGPLKTVKKVLRKVAVVQAGVVTGGLIKGKALGIKSKSSTKLFKTTAKVTRVVAAAAVAVIAAPIVAPYLASAGSAVLGGLKFAGGKLISAPKAFLSMLTGKGKNPATMSTEEVIKEGIESGLVTNGMLDQLGPMIPGLYDALTTKPSVDYPGGATYPASPEGTSQEGASQTGGGIMDTLGPMLPWIGVGVVAIVVLPSLLRGRK